VKAKAGEEREMSGPSGKGQVASASRIMESMRAGKAKGKEMRTAREAISESARGEGDRTKLEKD